MENKIFQIRAPLAPLRRAGRADAPLDTQAFCGERAEFLKAEKDWAQVRLLSDNYIGFVPAEALSLTVVEPTHRVIVPHSLIFPEENFKTPPSGALTMGAEVHVEGENNGYARMAGGGYIFAQHLRALDFRFPDFVAVAEQFLHAPYLWGGKSVLGIDCSGLVQLSLFMAGMRAPRDSGPQEKALGHALSEKTPFEDIQRGDLLFWPGHVAIACGQGSMIHATAFAMQTIIEPIAAACARIAGQGMPLSAVKRL